jgi:pathogenicity locus Cdd1 protein
MSRMPADTPLTAMPNVGPTVARKLSSLGIHRPEDLRGQNAEALFDRLCALDGRPHDPCLLDTFTAAVAFADGGPARPWWEFSRERKQREAADTRTAHEPSQQGQRQAAVRAERMVHAARVVRSRTEAARAPPWARAP